MAGYLVSDNRKVTTHRFMEMKQKGEKISMLTSYDYTMAGIEFDKLLLLNTWISLEGFPEDSYEVMLVVNGVGMTL